MSLTSSVRVEIAFVARLFMGWATTLWSFRQAFEDNARFPFRATVDPAPSMVPRLSARVTRRGLGSDRREQQFAKGCAHMLANIPPLQAEPCPSATSTASKGWTVTEPVGLNAWSIFASKSVSTPGNGLTAASCGGCRPQVARRRVPRRELSGHPRNCVGVICGCRIQHRSTQASKVAGSRTIAACVTHS